MTNERNLLTRVEVNIPLTGGRWATLHYPPEMIWEDVKCILSAMPMICMSTGTVMQIEQMGMKTVPTIIM
jgi:hypothetical protein